MIKALFLKNWLGFIFGVLLSATAAQEPVDEPYIRVAIVEEAAEVSIAGSMLTVAGSGGTWDTAEPIALKTDGKEIEINGKDFRSPIKIVSSDDFIQVNNYPYRGTIVIYNHRGKLLVVDELPLEVYLVGLINSETYSTWPREAIRAQAVVARTYALHRAAGNKNAFFDVRATVLDQCYLGSRLEDPASRDAVSSTRGQALSYGEKIAETFYYSTCGGATASSKEVWGSDFPYLSSVICTWCADSPRFFWKFEMTGEAIGGALAKSGIHVGELKKLRAVGKTSSGRNDLIFIEGTRGRKTIKATTFRQALGYTNLFSTWFDIFELDGGGYKFLGRGSGHGVGMCQWGSRGLALDGKTYQDILLYYYNGCSIKQLY